MYLSCDQVFLGCSNITFFCCFDRECASNEKTNIHGLLQEGNTVGDGCDKCIKLGVREIAYPRWSSIEGEDEIT